MLENWVGKGFAAAVRMRRSWRRRRSARRARLGRATKVDASYKVFASERHIKFTEMEYAVPRERGRDLIEGVLEIVARPELHVAWPIEVRFVKGDDSFLSPSHEQDTCYVAVHQDRKLAWEPYFRRVESLARELGGRPHWGKRHFRTAADLAPAYPKWAEFADARKRLDPTASSATSTRTESSAPSLRLLVLRGVAVDRERLDRRVGAREADAAEVLAEGRQVDRAADHLREADRVHRLEHLGLRLEHLVGAVIAKRLAREPDESEPIEVVQVGGDSVAVAAARTRADQGEAAARSGAS